VTRTQDLVVFLEQWLDFDRIEHALLWDVIRHELALVRLSSLAAAVPALPAAESLVLRTSSAISMPRVCGDIILHEMRCDPRFVGATLREKSPRLDEVPLGRFHFGYWRKIGAAEIHILQLDQLGFYLLSFADGKHSLADLSRMIGGKKQAARGMLKAVNEFAAVGILEFDTATEQGS
jgi:hypothetical protein